MKKTRAKRSRRAREADRACILAHIRAHPGCMGRDIMSATGLRQTYLSHDLDVLKLGGHIYTTPGTGMADLYWHAETRGQAIHALLIARLPDLDTIPCTVTRYTPPARPVRSPERPARRDRGIQSSFRSLMMEAI